MATELKTEITINADVSSIWNILIDFKSYPEWNPFITKLDGELKEGKKLNAHIDGMKFNPTILICLPNQKLEWIGRLILPGIFDGKHNFELIPNGDGTTKFIQSESFSGLLVPIFRNKLLTKTKDGFIKMNEALKNRVESAG